MKPTVYHKVCDPNTFLFLCEVWFVRVWRWSKSKENKNRKLYHRTDGPAIIFKNGATQWYVDDVKYADSRECDFDCSLRNWAREALEYENEDECGVLQSPVTDEMIEEHVRKVLANVVEGQI